MLKSFLCNALNLFVIMLHLQLVSSQLPPDQVSAMTRVYEIFQNDTGASFKWKSSGKNSNPCSWEGVSCSSDDSSIKKLSFSRFSISTSEFLPFLCSVTTLESIDVSNNLLTSIPVEFYSDCGRISGLKLLNFSMNRLSGSLTTFNGFRMLDILDFSRNSMAGEIDLQLDGLGSLKSLNLSRNEFSGTIPTNLGKMNLLEDIRLSGNFFIGEIPGEITKYRNLSVIDFSGNDLSGSIPAELLSGPNLQSLDLSFNRLEGLIPAIKSTKLIRLRLGSNSLNGTIPSESLESLEDLMYLELDNNRLSGEIPLELGWCGQLALLNLSQNSLTGSLPSILGDLTNLQVLSLQFNNFFGEIPQKISQLSRLEKLNISMNSLSGTIPVLISKLSSLTNFDLQSNNLSGCLPDSFASLSSLRELQLGNNQITGHVPDMPLSLHSLNLSYNLFRRPIPDTLSKLEQLEVLDLSHNRFSGKIPDFLGQLRGLTLLLLSDNELSGVVPKFGYNVVVDTGGNDKLGVLGENPSPRPQRSIDSDFILAFGSGIPVGLLITLAIFVLRRYNRTHCYLLTESSIYRSNIDFKKAMEAVSNPSNITLKTRFSTYYKAVMQSGTTYSVKKINRSNKIFRLHSREKIEEELEDIGTLCHSNVMIPLAYVLTVHDAYLFYDFAPKCTLSYILHHRTSDPLDWASRYNIALGVSRGLAFLHECNSGQILVLDLSSESIFMRSMIEPQIGDIELCKLIRLSKGSESIPTVAGSVGYISPEYANTMRVTAKGNVYSFGVVLLELLTGKPAVSGGTELAKWVLSHSRKQHNWEEILDVSVSKTSLAVRSRMLAVLEVALACISTEPETRPNMVNVLQMLLDIRS